MATTALFAEILVVGLLALPWMALAIVSVNGPLIPVALDLHGWDALGVAGALAFAYAVGILVDRLGDALFEGSDERISQAQRRARRRSQPQPFEYPDRPQLRFQLMQAAPTMAMEFLDYARSRRRIVRGLAVNSALTFAVAIIDLIVRVTAGRGPMLAFSLSMIIVATLLLGIGAVATWFHIGVMYYRRSLVAYDLFVRPGSVANGLRSDPC